MSKRICVYPGSFDPVTTGHMDIIRRGAQLFDEVVVAVIRNPNKHGCFTMQERMDMIRTCCRDLPGIRVECFEGLTIDFVRRCGANAMLRGLRSEADFDSELTLSQVNHAIAPEIETVFLMSLAEHRMVSSSAVREMASFGCSLSGFVPDEITEQVQQHFRTGD